MGLRWPARPHGACLPGAPTRRRGVGP